MHNYNKINKPGKITRVPALMKMKNKLPAKLSFRLGFAFTLAVVAWLAGTGCATNTSTGTGMKPMKGGEHHMMLNNP